MEKLGYFDSVRFLPILNMSTEFYLFSEKTESCILPITILDPSNAFMNHCLKVENLLSAGVVYRA